MLLKSLQSIMDTEKPAFEYTRNLLAVIAYWTGLGVTWLLIGTPNADPEAFPSGLYRFLIVPCLFGFYLLFRLVKLTTALCREIGDNFAKSEWWAIRQLSFAIPLGGVIGLAGFALLLSFNLVQVVSGVMRLLSHSTP